MLGLYCPQVVTITTSKKAFICFWTRLTNLHWMTRLPKERDTNNKRNISKQNLFLFFKSTKELKMWQCSYSMYSFLFSFVTTMSDPLGFRSTWYVWNGKLQSSKGQHAAKAYTVTIVWIPREWRWAPVQSCPHQYKTSGPAQWGHSPESTWESCNIHCPAETWED